MERPPVIVARQPICDRDRTVRAYELLFRAHDRERALVVDDEQATAHVLVTAFGDIGPRALVGSRLACVNVSRRFLLDVAPLPIGPERLVLELLEDQLVDAELLDRCAALVAAGYRLALDDFTFAPAVAPLLELAAMVKIDVHAHGLDGARRQVAALDGFRGLLVAEKVEDEAQFAACAELGFDLFQGWFFCRPELVEGRAIATSALEAMHTAANLAGEPGLEELEEIVSRDPGLSVRLLRLIGSAAVPTVRPIATIREALVMLGERTVRRWAMLIVLAGLPATSDELLPTALVRARLLESLAAERGDAEPGGAFVVGLLSVADALLGAPMDTVLGELPLASDHVDALLRGAGPNGRALEATLAHERGERWPVALAGVPPERFGAAYLEALEWARGCAPGLLAA